MSDAVLLLSQVFSYYGQSRFVRDGIFLSELRRIGDEFAEQNEPTIAEEHFKLALALYEAFFLEHHGEALASVRRLCDLLDGQGRTSELSRTLEWAFIIVQRLNAQALGEVPPAALEAVNWQKLFNAKEDRLVVGGNTCPRTRTQIHVLLVEDNPSDAELLKEYLAEADTEFAFNVNWARRLADGIREAGQGNIDVVLLDLSLPDSSSLETFYRISSSVSAAIPVIVLTGTNDRGVAIKAIKKGAHDFLVKGKDDNNVIIRSILEAVEKRKHRDIERVSVNSAMRSVEQSIQQAPAPMLFIDSHGIVQSANQSWLEKANCTKDDLVGNHLSQVCAALSRATVSKLIGGQPLNSQVSINNQTWSIQAWSVDSPDNGVIGALIRGEVLYS